MAIDETSRIYVNREYDIVDHRSFMGRFWDSLTVKSWYWVPPILLVFMVLVPVLAVIVLPLLMILMLFFWRSWGIVALPMDVPIFARQRVDPKTSKNPLGVTVLGQAPNGQLIYSRNERSTRHIFLAGTTGSGKSVTLVQMAALGNLVTGGGFFDSDGKGATDNPRLYRKLLRMLSREDDFLIFNFNKQEDYGVPSTRMETNTIGPMQLGPGKDNAETLKSMMAGAGQGGQKDMWTQRAESLVDTMSEVTAYNRDKRDIPLTMIEFSKFLNLKYCLEVAQTTEIPEFVRRGLLEFLSSIGLDDPTKFDEFLVAGKAIPTESQKQFMFVIMQAQPVFSFLGRTFGFMFDSDGVSCVDPRDLVLGHRVLFNLLPSMTKSKSTLEDIGQILFTVTRMMGAKLLGTDWRESDAEFQFTPTVGPLIYPMRWDELGFYMPREGLEIKLSQDRSLNVCNIITVQDPTQLGDSLSTCWVNTNIKILGKTEVSGDAKEFIENAIPKRHVLRREGMEAEEDDVSTIVRQSSRMKWEDVPAFEMSELAGLDQGQFYILVDGQFYDARVALIKPDQVKASTSLTGNEYYSVKPHSPDVVSRYTTGLTTLAKRWQQVAEAVNDGGLRKSALSPENEAREVINILLSARSGSGLGLGMATMTEYRRTIDEQYSLDVSMLGDMGSLVPAGDDTQGLHDGAADQSHDADGDQYDDWEGPVQDANESESEDRSANPGTQPEPVKRASAYRSAPKMPSVTEAERADYEASMQNYDNDPEVLAARSRLDALVDDFYGRVAGSGAEETDDSLQIKDNSTGSDGVPERRYINDPAGERLTLGAIASALGAGKLKDGLAYRDEPSLSRDDGDQVADEIDDFLRSLPRKTDS